MDLSQKKNHSAQTFVMPGVQTVPKDATFKILITSGPLQGTEVEVTRFPFVIGSGIANDLSLADSAISRRHCQLLEDEKGLLVEDLGSTNGTFIESVKVTSARLAPNTELQLGRTRLVAPYVPEKVALPMSAREQFGNTLGRSRLMRHVFYLAENAANCNSPVLILGESGVGKEDLAKDIHAASPHKDGPFIVVDCTGATPKRAQGELFGKAKTQGGFDLAKGGTLFIYEVDALPLEVQAQVLRTMTERPDVRLICASSSEKSVLVQLISNQDLRQDFFYKISVITIEMPALRRRKDDIPLLARSMATRLRVKDEIRQWLDNPATVSLFRRYDWPGNLRELQHVVEQIHYTGIIPKDFASLLERPDTFDMDEHAGGVLPDSIAADAPFKDAKNQLIEEFERKYLNDLLARNEQNISRSAREAGIERAYLQRLIRKYGMRISE